MYAVIFRAEINQLDESYSEMAAQMRALAMDEYGCTEFTSVTEGSQEISISYWPDQESIRRWKQDPGHVQAQELGKAKWYASYRVEVVEVLRAYGN